MEFERKELQKIRQRAERVAGEYVISTSWKRAYLALADAANILDAKFARREEELKKMDVSPKMECFLCNREIKDVKDENEVSVLAGKSSFVPTTWGICDSCLKSKEKK